MPSRRLSLAVAALVPLVVLAAPGDTAAYRREISAHGMLLRWPAATVGVELEPSLEALPQGAAAVIRHGFSVWTGPSCAGLRFVFDGGSARVRLVTGSWNRNERLVAFTDVRSDPDTGHIISAVIELNGAYRFSTEKEPSPGAIDLQSVIVHEVGHLVGLAHSNSQGAVMQAGIELGETRVNALTADDRTALCAAYPVVAQATAREPPASPSRRWLAPALGGALLASGAVALAARRSRRRRRQRGHP